MLPPDFIAQADFGFTGDATNFLASLETQPPTSIRLHLLKSSHLAGLAKMPAVAWENQGRYLPERLNFTTEIDFWAGAYYVQEASSMFVGEVLKQTLPLEESLCVLDLCAAPGGKSTHILSLLSEDSVLVSNEIVRSRAQILNENIARAGYGNAIVTNHHAARIGQLTGVFDAIVLDAPCSGEGMFRKNKEARGEWSLANVQMCAERQQTILEEIAPCLKEGGILIYSTCTFNTVENEKNLYPLLEEGWESVPLQVPQNSGILACVTEDEGNALYSYRFYPHLLQGEGFFLSCLRKTDAVKSPKKLHVKNPHLTLIPPRKQDFLKHWIADLDEFEYYQTDKNEIFALPAAQATFMHLLGETLSAWNTGYHIGTRKHEDMEPAPAWALALAGKVGEDVPQIALPTEDALEFLRRNELKTALPAQKGWHLATYNGLGLGWLKALPNRWNNYYPAQWRIRNF